MNKGLWREPVGLTLWGSVWDREGDGLLIGLRLRKISVNRHNLRGFKL
jgi:hypothetical protein